MIEAEKRKIKHLFLLLLAVLLAGTCGYMLIEGFTFIEALFMTIITITTVGYGTIRDLSDGGIIFTIILISTSFLIVAFIAQSFTQFITDGEFKKSLIRRKIKKAMKKIKNHVIVCGYGQNGMHAVKELLNNDEIVVVIDNSNNIEEYAIEQENVVFIKGDARDEYYLKQAKIDEAKALIASLGSDADNLFVVLTARELNKNLTIVSRANDDSSDRKLKIAGADHVILPDSVGGVRMAKLVTQPDVIEFLENILAKSGITVNLVEIDCNTETSSFIGKSLADLDIRKKSGANIIGMRKKDGSYIFNPPPEMIIEKGAKLFVLGTPSQIISFKEITTNNKKP